MDIDSNPLVTVLIPVYNRESAVESVRSIVNQTYDNLDILIMDNASTDRTVEKIKELNDERIRIIINEKNLGQTESMNRGIDLARGKYIARLDSDDIAAPNRIKKQVCYMEEHDECGICGCWVKNIDPEGRTQMTVKYCTTDEAIRFSQLFFIAFSHPCVMMRTAVLRENNIHYPTNYKIAEDLALWYELLKITKAANIPETLVYYRKSLDNDSKRYADVMKYESFEIKKLILEEYFSSETERAMMSSCLKEMFKENNTVLEFIHIYETLNQLCENHINKDNEDWYLLKTMIKYQSIVYGIFNNNAFWATILTSLYHTIYKGLFLIGGKLKQE